MQTLQNERVGTTVDDKKNSCITLRTLNCGNSGRYFLIMGNAGFISPIVRRFRSSYAVQRDPSQDADRKTTLSNA